MTARGSRGRSAPSSSRSSVVVLVVSSNTEGEEVKICLASILSSIRAICPNRVRRRDGIISTSRNWLVWHRTSSLEMKWYHSIPSSILRHHWWRALILDASSLVIAQHSDPQGQSADGKISHLQTNLYCSFSALMLLAGWQEGQMTRKRSCTGNSQLFFEIPTWDLAQVEIIY